MDQKGKILSFTQDVIAKREEKKFEISNINRQFEMIDGGASGVINTFNYFPMDDKISTVYFSVDAKKCKNVN